MRSRPFWLPDWMLVRSLSQAEKLKKNSSLALFDLVCAPRCGGGRSVFQFLDFLLRMVVRGILFERLLIVLQRMLFITRFHVRFGQAVVHIPGVRMKRNIELENADRFRQVIALH